MKTFRLYSYIVLALGFTHFSVNAQTDITASYFLISDSILNPGEICMGRYIIHNPGTGELTENFHIYHYLSKDDKIDASDILVHQDSIKDHHLMPGGSHGPIHAVFVLPDQIDSGQYRLILQVDPKDKVQEGAGENNNIFVSTNIQIRLPKGNGPDLTAFISDVGDNHGLFHPGDVIPGRSYMNNSGNENSPDSLIFYTFYMLCADSVWNPDKLIRIGGESIQYPILVGQGRLALDEDLKFPPDLKPGKYTLWLTIDPTNVVEEINEDNNIRLYGNIEITIPLYKQWWAKLIYVILTAIALWGLYLFLKRRIELSRALRKERKERERMQELDRVKSQLFTNITHEFRTPLTVILGMTDQVRQQYRRHERQGVESNLSMIERNGKNLLTLINQMLDLAKLESDTILLQPILGDVVDYTRYIFESLHSYAEMKGIHTRFLTDLDHLDMDYDPKRLQQIIYNLISNAIKFTPNEGYVEIELKKLPAQKEIGDGKEDILQIAVSDTGIGIPASKLPFIFDRFYQVDDTHTKKVAGSGIGLALAQELTKLMNGKITVESEEGKGSTFYVNLPIRQEAERVEIKPAIENFIPEIVEGNVEVTSPIESKTEEERPVVLVIEDNADVRQYIRACLQEKYQVEVAVNGQVGVDKAIELIPDVIVSDVMMPEKDGFEVCDILKQDERTSHIPFILLTAKAAVEDRLAGLKRGADAYLTKPFNREELLIRIDQLLKLRKRLQLRYAQMTLPATPAIDEAIKVEDAFLLKIQALIKENLSDTEYGIEQVCDALALSRSQLHRKLKALTDRSSSHYIRSIRLQKGKELLLTTDLSMSEVAYDVGFSDPNYFSRAFLKEFGQRPTELKKT